jgi:hypothetical protein
MNPKSRPVLLLALTAALAGGCGGGRPKAPPLTNDAVYQNDKVGLRFLVPEGWVVVSRADVPSGPLTRTVVLAAYHSPHGERAADLEVLAADVAEGADAGAFAAEHRVGTDRWVRAGAVEQVTVNGAAVTRQLLSSPGGKEEYRREVTAFRRGDRVYAFLITYAAADPASRDAARKAVESATWKE